VDIGGEEPLRSSKNYDDRSRFLAMKGMPKQVFWG
jgi:hypothetical protein